MNRKDVERTPEGQNIDEKIVIVEDLLIYPWYG